MVIYRLLCLCVAPESEFIYETSVLTEESNAGSLFSYE